MGYSLVPGRFIRSLRSYPYPLLLFRFRAGL
ncbi:MAG: hypothetical protein ACI906_000846 [Candidatus Latescibacterota bacterium]|jgi:hypothetical protein